jgi:hypothetical protein
MTVTLDDTKEAPASPASGELFPKMDAVLRRSIRWRTAWGILGGVALLLAIAATWAAWFIAIPNVYRWGFQPLSWWAFLSIIGILLLSVIPFGLMMPGFSMLGQTFRAVVDSQESDLTQKLDDIRGEQQSVEKQLGDLERGDASGLMHIVKYSRLQLEAYYAVGLRQTQQSYRNSVIAMWLGFAIIMVGVLRQIVPLNIINEHFSAAPTGFDPLVLAGGVVVEIISALFLWVYKSSIEQLTYFYDRQMHLHGVLLSVQITSGMKDKDDTTKLIVNDILAKSWRAERSPLPDSSKLKSLLSRSGAA